LALALIAAAAVCLRPLAWISVAAADSSAPARFAPLAPAPPAALQGQAKGPAAASGADRQAEALKVANKVITARRLRMHLSFLAADELAGRDTPSVGLDVAARYLATRLRFLGLKPLGDAGSYFQNIAMTRRRILPQSTLTLRAGGKELQLHYGSDWFGRGRDLAADAVFAGYGLRSKKANYDNFAGLKLAGKVAIVLAGYPRGKDPKLFTGGRRLGTHLPAAKYRLARGSGALGLIVLTCEPAAEQDLPRQPGEELVFDFREKQAKPELMATLSASATERLAKLAGLKLDELRKQYDAEPRPKLDLPAIRVEAHIKYEVLGRPTTRNVIAALEGADPKLRNEYVAYSAHYDHIGVRAKRSQAGGSANEDRLCNGADDDGTGTAALLALAEAFAAGPRPKRSILFVWHTAEEKGLVGSDYFTQHPTVPLDRIVADINLDMIGRNFEDKPENRDQLFLVGAAQTSEPLRKLILELNRGRFRIDENDRRNYFRRSDQFNYAKHGIPVAFFTTGEHRDYHKPSDEVEHIVFEKYERIVRFAFEIGWTMANRPERPAFTGKKQ